MQIHSIELTNHCNLRCGYCLNGAAEYPTGFLRRDRFEKALNHVIDGVGVGLSGCGESLIHPDICYFIKLACQRGINPGLNTNGTLLTPDLCKALVDAGLKRIEISIHTEESYKGYKMFKELNLPIDIQANVLTVNLDKAKKWRGSDKLPFRVQSTHDWADGEWHHPTRCVFIQRDWCMMKWDGTIVACCYDFNGDAIVGHIDDFDKLKHTSSYQLCLTCSPSWVLGQNDRYWDDKN